MTSRMLCDHAILQVSQGILSGWGQKMLSGFGTTSANLVLPQGFGPTSADLVLHQRIWSYISGFGPGGHCNLWVSI